MIQATGEPMGATTMSGIQHGVRMSTKMVILAKKGFNVLDDEERITLRKEGIVDAIERAVEEFVEKTGRKPSVIYLDSSVRSTLKEVINQQLIDAGKPTLSTWDLVKFGDIRVESDCRIHNEAEVTLAFWEGDNGSDH